MMSLEESLGDWSRKMRFRQKNGTLGLTEEQLKELTSVQMQLVWRNILQYVKPKQEVERIRKNLLLHKLKKDMNLDKKINMKLTSIDQLQKYEEMNKIKQENEKLEEGENYFQEQFKANVLKNKLKKNKLNSKKTKLEDTTTTLEIWKLKQKSIEDKIRELVEVEEIINELKQPLKKSSFDKQNENKSKVSECIPRIIDYVKLRRIEDVTEKEKQREYQNVLDFISENTFSIQISTILTTLLDSIACYHDNTKKLVWKDVKEPEMTQMLISVDNELLLLCKTQLNTQVTDTNKGLSKKNKELEKCKREFVMDIRKLLNLSDKDDGNTFAEYLENLLRLVFLEEESIAITESTNRVVDEIKCKSIDKFEMDMFQSKFACLNNDFYKKGLALIKCNSSLASSNQKLRDTSQEISDSISETLTKYFNNVCDDPLKVLQDCLEKEIKLFMEVPLVAMTRSWEYDLQLDYKTIQKTLGTPLFEILSCSEQNCLNYVLYLICWSESLKHTNPKQIKECKDKVCNVDGFNCGLKEAVVEVEKAENEVKNFKSIVSFYKNLPVEHFIPAELTLDGVGYSKRKKMRYE